MDPITGAAAIGAAGGVGTGLMNWRQADINRDFQRDMYHTQRKDALSDWKRNTEYNKPENQVKRMREAGINPMLAYGKGISQQTAQPVRSSQAGTGSVARLDNPFAQIPSAIAQAGQIKVNQQQVKLNSDLNQAKVLGTIATAIKDKALAKDIVSSLGFKIENIMSQTALNNARTDLSADQLYTQALNRRLSINKDEREYLRLESDMSKALSEVYRNRAQTLNIKADTELKGVERQKVQRMVKYYEALADYTGGRAQGQYLDNILRKAGIDPRNSTKYQRAAVIVAEEMSGAQFDNKMHIINGKEIGQRIESSVSKIATGSWLGDKAQNQRTRFKKFYDSMNNKKGRTFNIPPIPKHPRRKY